MQAAGKKWGTAATPGSVVSATGEEARRVAVRPRRSATL